MAGFVKFIFILISISAFAVPFGVQSLLYYMDRKNKTAYKNLFLIPFAIVYVVGMIVLLAILDDLVTAVAGWSFVQKITEYMTNGAGVSEQTQYYASVITVLIVNILIAVVYFLLNRLIRLFIVKVTLKEEQKDLASKVVTRFRNEKMQLLGQIVTNFTFFLMLFFAVVQLVYQLPVLFGNAEAPYQFIRHIYDGTYHYSMLMLIVMWSVRDGLRGANEREIAEEPSEAVTERRETKKAENNFQQLSQKLHEDFSDNYVESLVLEKKDDPASDVEDDSFKAEDYPMTRALLDDVDGKNLYARAVAGLLEESGSAEERQGKPSGNARTNLIVNGSFFSSFLPYFLRYIYVILARGENVVFLCNSAEEIDSVADFLTKGMSCIQGMYDKRTGERLDEPLWKVTKIDNYSSVWADDSLSAQNYESSLKYRSLLVTVPEYLCSNEFARQQSFIQLIDTVVLVNTVEILSRFYVQLASWNTRFEGMIEKNLRNVLDKNIRDDNYPILRSKKLRYVCFDEFNMPSVKDRLSKVFGSSFKQVNAITYDPETILDFYHLESGNRDYNGALIVELAMRITDYQKDLHPTVLSNGMIPEKTTVSLLKGKGEMRIDKVNMSGYSAKIDFNNRELPAYGALVVLDKLNNLPAAIRQYGNVIENEASLLSILSRPYMLRDYFESYIHKYKDNPQRMQDLLDSDLLLLPDYSNDKKIPALNILLQSIHGISEERIYAECYSRKSDDAQSVSNSEDKNAVLKKYFKQKYKLEEDDIPKRDLLATLSDDGVERNPEAYNALRSVLRESGLPFDVSSLRERGSLSDESFLRKMTEWERMQYVLNLTVNTGEEEQVAELVKKALAKPALKAVMDESYPFSKRISFTTIMMDLLRICNDSIDANKKFADFFDCKIDLNYDIRGQYNGKHATIKLRGGEDHLITDSLLEGHDLACFIKEGERKQFYLSLSKDRLGQNYLEGQELVFRGENCTITKVDLENGIVYGTSVSKPSAIPQYRQLRQYSLDLSKEYRKEVLSRREKIEYVDGGKARSIPLLLSSFRTPLQVITRGYYALNAGALRFIQGSRTFHGIDESYNDGDEMSDESKQLDEKQKYMRTYGRNIFSSSDRVYGTRFPEEAKVLTLKIVKDFDSSVDRITVQFAVMLNELLGTFYPYSCDSFVVLPVLHISSVREDADKPYFKVSASEASALEGTSYDTIADALLEKVDHILPSAEIKNESLQPNEMELIFVEDSKKDLGIITSLMSDDNVLKKIFRALSSYLEWREKSDENKEYLRYGEAEELDIFNSVSLRDLLRLITGNVNGEEDEVFEETTAMAFSESEEVAGEEYEKCCFCCKRKLKHESEFRMPNAEDDRYICLDCYNGRVGKNYKNVAGSIERDVKAFFAVRCGIPEEKMNYKLKYDSFYKIAQGEVKPGMTRINADVSIHSYVDAGARTGYIEYDIPKINLAEAIVRTFSYLWLQEYAAEANENCKNAAIAIVAMQYLNAAGAYKIAEDHRQFYSTLSGPIGSEYQRLIGEIQRPETHNNVLQYLQTKFGRDVGFAFEFPPRPEIVFGRVREASDTDSLFDADSLIEDTAEDTAEEPFSERAAHSKAPTYFWKENLPYELFDAYDQITTAVQDAADSVRLEAVSEADAAKAAKAVYFDHPEFFYWNGKFTSVVRDGENLVADLDYTFRATERVRLKSLIQDKMQEFLPMDEIANGASAYDIALRIHSKIAEKLYVTDGEDASDSFARTVGNVVGGIVEKRATSQGYAKTLQLLLQSQNIECGVVAGQIANKISETADAAAVERNTHYWNVVKLEGDYYFIDPTKDDNPGTVLEISAPTLNFDYFCITSQEVEKTCSLDRNPFALPLLHECNQTACNYYAQNGLWIHADNRAEYRRAADWAIDQGVNYIALKCDSDAVMNAVVETVMNRQDDILNEYAESYKAKFGKKCLIDQVWKVYRRDTRTVLILFRSHEK